MKYEDPFHKELVLKRAPRCSDKTTSIVQTKKLRDKETQKQFVDFAPTKMSYATYKHHGKVLEAMVIASSDDEENLNDEEKLFEEKNPHLFDEVSPVLKPSRSGARKRKNPPVEEVSPSSAKKAKADDSDEARLLKEFLKEQGQKEAALKIKRNKHPKPQTVEAGVQCGSRVVLKQAADASVQTDYNDITSDLKEQVRNLTEVVKQLTALKCIHQHESETPNSPLFEDDQLLDTAMDVIRDFCQNPTPSPPLESASAVHESRPNQPPVRLNNNDSDEQSPVYRPQVAQPRQPLMSVDQNIIPQPLLVTSYGPTDDQRRKVGAIVDFGKDLSTTALACVDVLFTDDEMATANVSGTRGFQQLDSSKMRFLILFLQRKFDSPSFSEEWSQIVARINTKCRGKRRTLIQRLKKHT